jgi:hypothetical protein
LQRSGRVDYVAKFKMKEHAARMKFFEEYN